MKKITMTVGLFDKETKKQEINTVDAYKILENVFTVYTGGATIFEGRGIYTHDNGAVVVEPSMICYVYTDSVANVKAAADVIKAVLNQESVAIEVTEVNTEFY